ncbi:MULTISPECIES: glutathione peroxidase [Bacillus]|uniref:glutathione peroxidase n=1 Tax=Bacillus TaxID=1386 RepID=UPI0022448364|nr:MULTISPECIES: glutathione peroxidase [Bacillus]MDN5386182.1 glutathione peroxidase [Bacillus sp. LB7]MEC1020369.1 glutathione peroxidase [Bacillus paralicheniformis]MEC1026476.1 glutathione peroxidase [Bacillus paralicheniformis]MEC1036705.1 glutathione peroxidase [Bacillus paralicheniformis]MEC1052848.1 glutathione peroxidase [Bacillus paralicheniformis]
MSIYDISVKTIQGEDTTLRPYKGKVLLIVNTASKCGFTPQYQQLQDLYETYKDRGLEVLGFPSNQFMNQEPGDEKSIEEFCSVNYGVTFPMFSKVNVKGDQIHPLFRHLTNKAKGMLGTKAVKWNFTKFLVDRTGENVERFSPQTNPKEMEEAIQKWLG